MTTRFKRNTGVLAAAIVLGFAGAQSVQAQQSPSGTEGRATTGPSSQASAPVTPSGATATQSQRDIRVSQLIGMDVYNAEGKDLGEINDLVLDVDLGRVHYAVLGFGGFLGFGEKLFAFPLSAFQMTGDADRTGTGMTERAPVGADRTGADAAPAAARGVRDTADLRLVLNVPESRLKDAPGFDKDRWPDWNDAQYRGEVDRFAAANEALDTVSRQGNLRRASELLDAKVKDGQRADIGDIEDLIVDARSGEVRYAVVAFERGWTEPDRLVVLPMTALQRQQDRDDDNLTFAGDRTRLQQAPSFERNAWPDLNSASFRGRVDPWLAGWGGTTPGTGITGARDAQDSGSTAATGDARGTADRGGPDRPGSSGAPGGTGVTPTPGGGGAPGGGGTGPGTGGTAR